MYFSPRQAIRSAAVSYFNDFCRTNYYTIYRTDLRQIFRVGRTVAVDDQCEKKLIFRSLKGRCCDNQFLLVLSTQFGSGNSRQKALA